VDLDSRRTAFTLKALAALDAAAEGCPTHRPVDTVAVFRALTVTDVAAEWHRIWLEFGEPDWSQASQCRDPLRRSADRWQGKPLTGSCARAIRGAVVLSDRSGILPVSPGVLALCLIGETDAAATCALLAHSAAEHSTLLELAQEALVGGSWQNIGLVLRECFDAAETEQGMQQAEKEILDKVADSFEELLGVLTQFLRAETPAESGNILDTHPELLGDQVDRMLVKFLDDAREAGKVDSERHLRERRNYLRNYRRLVVGDGPAPDGSPDRSPDRSTGSRFGECPFQEHVWESSMEAKPDAQETVVRCTACHVGYLFEMRMARDGIMRVAYFVFPADGYDVIGAEVKMWAIATCESVIGQMEEDGMPVVRSTPVIGLRPESLSNHAIFTQIG
jgi:hypothetical protein